MATPSISSIDPRDQYRALYDVYLQSLQALHDHNSSVPHQLRANRVIELHAQLELLRTPTASTPTSLASGGSTTAGSTADAHAATYNLMEQVPQAAQQPSTTQSQWQQYTAYGTQYPTNYPSAYTSTYTSPYQSTGLAPPTNTTLELSHMGAWDTQHSNSSEYSGQSSESSEDPSQPLEYHGQPH